MFEKVFPEPKEVLFGQFNKPQLKAINFVKEKLQNNDFDFKPPYEIGQYADLIGKLLRVSTWQLNVDGEGEWKITPSI